MAKKKFYAVAKGRKPGIYSTWYGKDGAEEQVRGASGALFKGFPTRQEAEEWLRNPPEAHPVNDKGKRSTKRKEKATVPVSADVVLYTDGSALDNPGPGGYGVVIREKGEKRRELSGGFRMTTNNRMEMLACIVGLREFKKRTRICLFSDSRYVVNGITRGWARNWRARGWKKSDGESALNPDLWKVLLDLCDFHDVDFHWVKGHAGNPDNERCDQLATRAAANRSGHAIDHVYESEVLTRKRA